ncbi:MAG: hypothetical protein AAGB18_07165 [Pseudomonadota bacterium]
MIRAADGADVTPSPAKVRALVVLLALTPGLRQGRSWIQDKLWSDRGAEQGQGSLRQALTELRKALGADREILLARDGWIGFDPGAVAIDLSPPLGALDLSGVPELASGLEVADPEFEHWLRNQRLAFEDRPRPEAISIPAPQPAPSRASFLAQSTNWHLTTPLRVGLATVAFVIGLSMLATAQWSPIRPRSLPSATQTSQTSIAVLPFRAIDADGPRASLAEGASQDLVTDLSRFGSLFVIAAATSFRYDPETVTAQDVGIELGVRYVLEGSIQWLGEVVRVNARLIDTGTAQSVWADRFDRPAGDLLALQNEIVRSVVGVIGPGSESRGQIREAELKRLERLPTQDLEAYDHYLAGLVRYEEFSDAGNSAARTLFQKAREIDPDYARAFAREAWTHLQDYWAQRTPDPDASLAEAGKLALEAVDRDPAEALSLWALASVRLFERQHDQAIALYDKALALNPNDADLIMYAGFARAVSGEPEGALALMEEAVARNPYHPGWYLWDLGFGHFVARDYRAAIETLERRNPKSQGTYQLLAQAYAMDGRAEAAREAMETYMAKAPDFVVEDAVEGEPYAREDDLAHHLEALRRAGFPERGRDK